MPYFVKINSGEEMGPYEESALRDWLSSGVMPRDTPTRQENEAIARPACEVFPGIAPSLRFDPEPEVMASPYTSRDEPMLESGNFALGFILATICALPALCLIVWASPHIGPKTYRGMWWGVAMPLFTGAMGVAMYVIKYIVSGE
jgi:hypothetical protein